MTTKATSPLLLLSLGASLIVTTMPASADNCVGLSCNLNSVYVDLVDPVTAPFLVAPDGGPVSRNGVLIAVTASGCLPADVYEAPIEFRIGADTVNGDYRDVVVGSGWLPIGSIFCDDTDFDVEPSYYVLDFTQPDALAWATRMAEDHRAPYSWQVTAVLDPLSAEGDNDGTIDENGIYPDAWYTTEEYSDNIGSAIILGTNIIPASRQAYVGGSQATYTGSTQNWALGSPDCPTGFEIGEGQLTVSPGSTAIAWDVLSVAIGLGEPEPSFEYVCGRPDLSKAGPAGVPMVVSPIQTLDSATGAASGDLAGFALNVDFALTGTGATISNGTLELPAGLAWHETTPLPNGWDSRYRGFASPRGRTRFPLALNGDDMAAGFSDLFAGRNGYGARSIFLTSESLPFAVEARGIVIDTTHADSHERVQLVGPFTARWLRDPSLPSLSGTYGPIDPGRNRAVLGARGPTTNDALYSSVTLGCVVLAPDGLWAATGFDAGSGLTHFPRLDLTWSEEPIPSIGTCSTFSTSLPTHIDHPSYTVRASTLALRAPPSSKVRGRVDVRTDCPECSTTQAFSTLTIPRAADPVADWVSNEHGAFSFAGALAERVEWGPNAHSTQNSMGKIWRHEAAGNVARVIVPGFLAAGTTNRPVVDYLLASFSGVGRPTLFGDEEPRRGNGFFAGATVGPEIYRDGNGQPQTGQGDLISGTTLDAALGGPEDDADGPTRVSLTLAPGAKYVLRPGGVTGAFNFTSIPTPTVYGFPLALTRFAFTVLDNAGSPSSWVDGQLDLPAWAGFSVPFVSLTLECSGHLGGGVVDRGRLASLPAAKKRLRAWRADYDLSDVAFIPKTSAQGKCGAGPRELSTSGATTIAALTQKVDLTSAWEPTGAPSATNPPKLRGSSQLEFNRPAVVDEVNLGFTLDAKADQVLLAKTGETTWSDTVRGWFEFGGGLRLPFWKSPPVVVRLQNTLNEASTAAIADRTLVRKGGAATSPLWAQSNTSDTLWAAVSAREPPNTNASDPATMAWNDAKLETPFPWVFDKVKFPMRWLPDSQQRPVLVAGANQPDPGADLGIIKVQAAAPSTTPRETNITFGASADLKVLTKISVPTSIDLFSESNIKAIDTFLRNVTNISGSCPAPNQNESGPLWCILKDIRTPS
ncbi:MAG: hypothetical protein IV100_14285, partial [Myxococcales bacterium]|nr:hypothetical protein [Myxococcales bacterium]